MNKREIFETNMQEISKFAKAMSHPARLMILRYLAETKTCISGDISNILPLSRTTVGQHLKELKNSGLIQGHVTGAKTNYCLNPEQVERASSLLNGFTNEINVTKNIKCN